jgi:hypothetical protein
MKQLDKAKCRCVYPGNSETEGLDYLMRATDMPFLSTVRIFLALEPFKDEVAVKADISQAFLRAELEPIPANERRFVVFPADISPKGHDGKRKIYRAHRGIYGMHSAGRMWQELLFKWLIDHDFKQNECDKTLFTKQGLRVLVWTDDLVIRGTKMMTREFRRILEETFGDVRWKPLEYVLGMDVSKSPDGWLGIHSNSYVNKIVKREGLEKAKPKASPLPAHLRITKNDRADEIDLEVKSNFQRVLGQLSYLATWTRPDLSYSASSLGRVSHSPLPYHLKMARRVIAYLKRDPTLGLKWKKPEVIEYLNVLLIYSDASWAQEDGYCSQSGFIAMLNSAPVHWGSNQQEFPALSSTEAEIIAGCNALRHTLWLKRLLESLGFAQGLVRIFFDAENAIRFNTSEKVSKRNHHIGVRYMRVRYHVGQDITCEFVKTTDMLADVCTKNAEQAQFERLVAMMMSSFGDEAELME